MMRHLSIAMTWMSLLVAGVAQEKPVPGQREMNVTVPDSVSRPADQESTPRTSQALPKFEIPEYVITGVVTLDVPDVSKLDGAEKQQTLELANPVGASRDRQSYDFELEAKATREIEATLVGKGRLQASSGTYLTSHVGFRHSVLDPDYFFDVNGDYRSSKAFVPFAHRSAGEGRLRGGIFLNSPGNWFDRGMFAGQVGYRSETYRFYGSQVPSITRTLDGIHVAAEYESARELLITHEAKLGLEVNGIKDSSKSITETLFDVGAGMNFFVGKISFGARLDFNLASFAASSSQAYPFLDGQISSERLWYGDFFIQASVHGYLAQGMLGQKISRVYPHAVMGFRVLPSTELSMSYAGRVQQNTLTSLLRSQPYLSTSATLRQSDVPIDAMAKLETDWSPRWKTRFTARYQSIRDYPMITEGSSSGIWATDYRGTTRVGTYSGELFAKFNANSYFTLKVEINDSKNSLTEWKVPYLPDLRAGFGASIELLPGFNVSPTLSYVGKRVPDLFIASKLAEYLVLDLHAEYAIVRFFSITVDAQNLSDARYEVWNKYHATPFTLTGGLLLRW